MSELDKIFALLLIALAFSVSIIGVLWYHASSLEEVPLPSEPETEPYRGSGPEPEPYNVTLSPNNFEVTQGESFNTNLYLTSLVHETDATTTFSWFLIDYKDQPWPSTQSVPLEIIFNPNQPILKYHKPKTILITINSAEDAPLGEYRVNLELSASVVGSNFHTNRNLLITLIPSNTFS